MSAASRGWNLAAAALSSIAIVSLVAVPGLLGRPFARAVDSLSGAHPIWLFAAGASFGLSLVCSACAWRCALCECGGSIGRVEAGARYGLGSLVNTLVPGHAGSAVRIALFSRALSGGDRLWVASGVPAAIGAARAVLLAVLVLAAAGSGVLPVWTAFALAGAGGAAVGLCAWARGRGQGQKRWTHVLDVFRAFGRSPRTAARVLGWLSCSVTARLIAVATIAAALGVQAPIAAALVIVPALAVAAFVSLTPAGIGVTGGAVAVVLHQRGVDVTTALAGGIAVNAVETAAALTFGIASGLLLAFPSPAARRWTLVSLGASACLAFGFLGANTFVDFA